MVNLTLATKILGVFYKKWFESFVIGILPLDIDKCVEGDKNEILKAIEFLKERYLIEFAEWSYRITPTGIQRYEEVLPPSVVNERVTQRKKILEMLKEFYDKDVNQDAEDKEIYTKIGNIDKNELLGQVKYMESIGLVKLTMFMGGNFWIRLTGTGASTFEQQETHNYQVMSNAYRILFLLENNLRVFLKLYLKNGTQWWEKGISQGLRDKADEEKEDEENCLD